MLMDFDNCVLPCPYGYDRAVARTEKAGFQGAVAPWRGVRGTQVSPLSPLFFGGRGKKNPATAPTGMMRSLKFIRVILVIARRRKIMAIKTYGLMGVDWEERANFERLRNQRLARIKKILKESELGALLCFDMTNV